MNKIFLIIGLICNMHVNNAFAPNEEYVIPNDFLKKLYEIRCYEKTNVTCKEFNNARFHLEISNWANESKKDDLEKKTNLLKIILNTMPETFNSQEVSATIKKILQEEKFPCTSYNNAIYERYAHNITW